MFNTKDPYGAQAGVELAAAYILAKHTYCDKAMAVFFPFEVNNIGQREYELPIPFLALVYTVVRVLLAIRMNIPSLIDQIYRVLEVKCGEQIMTDGAVAHKPPGDFSIGAYASTYGIHVANMSNISVRSGKEHAHKVFHSLFVRVMYVFNLRLAELAIVLIV